jgi:hypothetical protein
MKRATFDIEKIEYCSKHKLSGMKDLINKRCKHKLCTKTATFGIKEREYCNEHKSSEMINSDSDEIKVYPQIPSFTSFTSQIPNYSFEYDVNEISS